MGQGRVVLRRPADNAWSAFIPYRLYKLHMRCRRRGNRSGCCSTNQAFLGRGVSGGVDARSCSASFSRFTHKTTIPPHVHRIVRKRARKRVDRVDDRRMSATAFESTRARKSRNHMTTSRFCGKQVCELDPLKPFWPAACANSQKRHLRC